MQYYFASPPPYPHQQEAVEKMLATKGRTALLMEPGTGKTRSVIDYLSLLATAKRGTIRTLVVAPVAALDTWIEQAGQYAPDEDTLNPVSVYGEVLEGSIEERADRVASFAGRGVPGFGDSSESVIREVDSTSPAAIELAVTNLESFSRRHQAKGADGQPLKTVTVLDRMVDAIRAWEPDVLVVDESHRIKSASSNTSLAMKRIADLIPRRLLLTGTVMPHSPNDVYGQWRTLAPEAFSDERRGNWNAAQWREQYAIFGGWQGKEIIGWRNLDDMQERMAKNSIVVRKADALDLPPTTDVMVRTSLSPREEHAYASMREEMAAVVDGEVKVAQNVLVKMLRLRQITSGYLPGEDGETTTIGASKVKALTSRVEDLLPTERRVVVFAHFIEDVKRSAEAIAKIKGYGDRLTVDVITGATPTAERTRMRKAFGPTLGEGDDIRVLVCQMRTMSLAVNELVSASHAIYVSISERRDDYVQSRDRLDRIGQTLPVTFHHLIAPGTVDDVILTAHRERTSVEEAVLAHVRGEETS